MRPQLSRMMQVKWLAGPLFVCLLFATCSTRRHLHDDGLGDWRQRTSSPGVLHIHATYTAPYCGGADPGPDGMPEPGPWRGMMFIRKATPDSTGPMARNEIQQPVLDTLRTGADGHGHLLLPVGHYLLLDRDRVDDQRYKKLLRDHAGPALHTEPIDKDCLDKWLHGPFGAVSITAGDTTRVELPLFDQCPWYNTPCVVYHGPLPP